MAHYRLYTTAVSVLLCAAVRAAEADSLAWEETLQATVVTATRTPKLLKDVPVPIRVITADDIRRADVANVAELLQQELPGLEFSWAMSREVSLNLSGFGGNSVLFLIDGERMAGETMNNPDYQRLSLDNVERIEIVRGAASSLYGSSAVGGVVNIITRKATRPVNLRLNAHAGSHADYRLGASLANALPCGWSNTLSAQYTHAGRYAMTPWTGSGELVSAGNHTWHFSDKMNLLLAKRLDITARAACYYRERGYDQTQNNRYRDYSGGLRGEYRFGRDHTLEVAYAFDQYDKSDYSLVTRYDVRDYSNVQHSLRALYNNKVCRQLGVTAGADFLRDYLCSYMFAGDGRRQLSAAAFAQADYEPLRNLELIGALRYDWFSQAKAGGVTAKVAARYTLKPNLMFRASYSGGFRAPTLKELYMDFDMAGIFMIYGNRRLKAERSHNVQLSVEYRPLGWELQASLYANMVSNRITTLWDAAATGLYGSTGAMRYQNVGQVDIVGVQANALRRWNTHWSTRASYCYNHVHVARHQLYSDNTRPHSLTARVDYQFTPTPDSRAGLSLSGRYLSPLDIYELNDSFDRMNDFKTHYHGYAILKLTAMWAWRGLDLKLSADNLLNYRPSVYTYYSPKTTGTSFTATLCYEL